MCVCVSLFLCDMELLLVSVVALVVVLLLVYGVAAPDVVVGNSVGVVVIS